MVWVVFGDIWRENARRLSVTVIKFLGRYCVILVGDDVNDFAKAVLLYSVLCCRLMSRAFTMTRVQ